MKKILRKILNTIWKDKGILFLLLVGVYVITAITLHTLYQNGTFAVKHYTESHYSFAITNTDKKDLLKFEITRSSNETEDYAKAGEFFTMNPSTIDYQNYTYKYNCSANDEHDYFVEFPDGETYAFDQYDLDRYYKKEKKDISDQKTDEAAAKQEFLKIHNSYWETQGISDEHTEVSESSDEPFFITVYLPTDAPDAKYSPCMIRSALSAYQRYTETIHLCNSESEIIKFTAPLWLAGTIFLCLMNYILEWHMAVLSLKLSFETTESEQILEPSKWRKFCHVFFSTLLLVCSYTGMIFWYLSLR